jgi:hypothetical protein
MRMLGMGRALQASSDTDIEGMQEDWWSLLYACCLHGARVCLSGVLSIDRIYNLQRYAWCHSEEHLLIVFPVLSHSLKENAGSRTRHL